jgi:hypothetical protein
MVQEKQGVLASIGGTIGGPRYMEQDEVGIELAAPGQNYA